MVPDNRRKDGNGVQALYFKLRGDERPPDEWGIPRDCEVGLKVYLGNIGEGIADTRDAAIRMQAKLAREGLAPRLFAKVRVYSSDGTLRGFGLVTEHVCVGCWEDHPNGMDSARAQSYLLSRLPGFGDLHEGNYGFHPRTGLPMVIDFGDHGVRRIRWTRIPGERARAAKAMERQRAEAEDRARRERKHAERHARRRQRGESRCHTCGGTLARLAP